MDSAEHDAHDELVAIEDLASSTCSRLEAANSRKLKTTRTRVYQHLNERIADQYKYVPTTAQANQNAFAIKQY
jgi:hypothetical protein